jgi:hypothetical protein
MMEKTCGNVSGQRQRHTVNQLKLVPCHLGTGPCARKQREATESIGFMEAFQMKRFGFVMGLVVVLLSRASAAAADDKIDVKALEKNLEKALKAYNDDDHKKFWAEFCTAANALKTKETFDALYTNGYKKQFGKFVKRGDLLKDKSTLEGEIGLVRYTAEFEKNKKLEMDINWVKEGKEIKFMQILINKPQE